MERPSTAYESHMATTRRKGAQPGLERKPFSFMNRLQEIGMFFSKRSPQHQTMRRLARRLKKAGIPYAVMGAMAVNAHGAERTTKDVDILLTPGGLERFRQEFVGDVYEPVEGRPRRFTERQSGVSVDCLISGSLADAAWSGGVRPDRRVFPKAALEFQAARFGPPMQPRQQFLGLRLRNRLARAAYRQNEVE